jgi:hypothetical protein
MRFGTTVSVIAGLGLALVAVSSATGCGKKVTKSDCARAADKGADLKLDEDPHWARLSLGAQAAYKSSARSLLEKSDSDLQQVMRCDPSEFTHEEYECCLKAKSFNEWGACIN